MEKSLMFLLNLLTPPISIVCEVIM